MRYVIKRQIEGSVYKLDINVRGHSSYIIPHLIKGRERDPVAVAAAVNQILKRITR